MAPMNRRHWLASGLTVLASGTASAKTSEPKHAIDTKIDKLVDKGGSTAEMVEAYDQGLKLWDAELNRVYKDLLALLSDADKTVLREAQRQWVSFRDAQLKFIEACYAHYEGTMYIPMHASAVMEVTRSRALDLLGRLKMHKEHAAG